jgi:ABC-type nitrate/sulfonate/bicarbonate transport system substrate-binding protein
MIALMLACAAPTQVNVVTPAQGSSPEAVAPAAAPTADQPAAPPPLQRVPMAYSVLGGDALAMWVAQEEGLYQRHGIDPDLTYIGGSTRIVEAIIAGEVRIAQVGGAATVAADLAGADIVEIGSLVPVFVLSMFAQPDIASVESLRGQSIAVTTLGTSTDFGARVVAKRAGLEPLRDVALIQSGGVPESLGALTSGRVQAAVFGPPTTLLARAAGLRELVDLSTTGVAYEQAPLGTTRRYLLERPEIVRGFLRAIVESIALIKRDPALAKRVLAQYTKTDDDARLEETYHLYVDNALQRVPYPNAEGLQTVLDLLDDPRAREARPEQFLDDSYLRELEASGFIGRLYDTPR